MVASVIATIALDHVEDGSEAQQEIAHYMSTIMAKLDVDMVVPLVDPHREYLQTRISSFIESVYQAGHREFFLRLSDSDKERLYQACRTRSFRFYAVLEELNPGLVAPILPGKMPVDLFEDFRVQYVNRFSEAFDNLGSVEFQKALHQYYVSHQSIDYWNDKKDHFEYISRNYDGLMFATCLSLRKIHGEDKVIKLLNLLISDTVSRVDAAGSGLGFKHYDATRVYAIDFFMILQLGIDFENLPLSWTLQFVPDEWRNERARFARK